MTIIKEDCVNADPKHWPCQYLKAGKCPEDCPEYYQRLTAKEAKIKKKKMELRLKQMKKSRRRPTCKHGIPLTKKCKKCQAGIGGDDNIRQMR